MKVLQMCISTSLGGLELYFFRASQYLKNNGHSVVAVAEPGTRLEKLHLEEGVKTFSMVRSHNYFPLSSARKLAKMIDNENIDLVHTHFKYDIAIGAFAKLFAKRPFKLVHTRHMEVPHKKRGPYYRWLYKSLDLFICITKRQREIISENVPYFDKERLKHLYYGVDLPVANKERQVTFFREYSSDSQSFKVGMFSRIGEGKGHHRLLKAMSLLKQKGHNISAYFVGIDMEDGYREKLDHLIGTYELKNQVHFCGFTNNPLELMSGFDVVALPSDLEAFGLVLIEAMRAGVCVMGSNSGGVPEIIDSGKNGFLFEVDSEEQFAEALEKVISNPALRKELAQAGKLKADEMFDTDLHFKVLISLYKSTLT